MRLEGKRALVIGGTSGIGEAVVARFAREGASVVAASRRCAVDDAQPGDDRTTIEDHVDIRDRTSIRAAATRVVTRWGRLDVVVNCAGVMTNGLLGRVGSLDVESMLQTNVVGTFNALAVVTPIMEQTGGGSIVVLSSTITRVVTVGTGFYRMTKAAVEAITQSAAAESARAGVRVNAVAAGFVAAGLSLPLIADVERWPKYKRLIMLSRPAEPDEIAAPIAFLASDEASYMTGEVVTVNGGLLWP
jgi:NAD(P)-dependent dehydrogenase (short-subunit alcohol dehydrogenase family)